MSLTLHQQVAAWQMLQDKNSFLWNGKLLFICMKKCYNKLTHATCIWHGLRRSIYACALCTLEDGILYEGLKLQKQCTWGQALKTYIVTGNASELFFVENNLGAFFVFWEGSFHVAKALQHDLQFSNPDSREPKVRRKITQPYGFGVFHRTIQSKE